MYTINLREEAEKKIYALSKDFYGKSPTGEELDFTNYYMRKNGKPVFGINGEFHFSRCEDIYWGDELNKMKQCGISVVSTYIFWNHHEEIEGEFCFEGRRDLRKFIELCEENRLDVIIRIGPFDHGEVRNGGLPDWLFGKPFEVRELSEGFLYHTKRLYEKIAEQLQELYYKDGGPIIACQIDNEYQHSSAPWELTTGVANEWIPGGHEGDRYMYTLRDLAKEVGIEVPFYTCTAWGGAVTPEAMMPLWGGYAYRPWLFYDYAGEHPATEEYRYSDFHNNEITKTGDFEPMYKPEDKPYACCEMGGGMMCSYYYRFQLPYKSVDAMANIKMASGCNFLGYYMFKGGTNPKGKYTAFLNEGQTPKLSYDYQAAIGEFGQLRESYQRLKALHYFAESFTEELCNTATVLPEGAMEIEPKDIETLRYAVRVKDDAGFLFINNFQDHVKTIVKESESILIQLTGEDIKIDDISLAADENCILPFNMDLDGIQLKYALAQPVTKWQEEVTCYLFMIPEGMTEKFVFEDGVDVKEEVHQYGYMYSITKGDKKCRILTVPRDVMNDLYQIEVDGNNIFLITKGALLKDKNGIRIESDTKETFLAVYPANYCLAGDGIEHVEKAEDIWREYRLNHKEKTVTIKTSQVGPTRYTVDIPEDVMDGVKEAILQIDYEGDIGQAFIDGDMIHDHFYNGATWEIGLKTYAERLKKHPLTIYITPVKKGVKVNVESTMAARKEEVEAVTGTLHCVEVKPIYEITASWK